MKNNEGKFKNFEDGKSLSSADLDHYIQQYYADELDRKVIDFVGDSVVRRRLTDLAAFTEGWYVLSEKYGLTVYVTSGTGYIAGQRLSTDSGVRVIGLPANTNNIKIYAQLRPYYSTESKSARVFFGMTTGPVPGDYVVLAYVSTSATDVVSITENVAIASPQSFQSLPILTEPKDFSNSVAYRIGMLINRLASIIGSTWTSVIPSLSQFKEVFDNDGGHTHNGTDSIKLNSKGVSFSAYGILDNNHVGSAIRDLKEKLISLSGGFSDGAINAGNPTSDLYLANKSYVDSLISSVRHLRTKTSPLSVTTISSSGSTLSSQSITFTSPAGLVSLETNGKLKAEGVLGAYYKYDGTSVTDNPKSQVKLTFNYWRNGTIFATREFYVQNPDPTLSLTTIFSVPIPTVFDTYPVGKTGSYVYKISVHHTLNYASPTVVFSSESGDFNIVEYR